MKIRNEFHAVLMRAQRTIPPQRSGDFAQAIIARYSAIERRWPLMALIFGQQPQADASVTNNYQVSHPSFFMNPRILLRMLVKQETHHSYTAAPAAAPLPNNLLAVQKVFSVPTKPESITVPSEELITRIVSRSLRNEVAPDIKTIKPSSSAESPDDFVARPKINLPLLFKRSVRDNLDSKTTSITNEAQTILKKSSDNFSKDVYTSPPAVDITRITDQVMQALDKRIVAQRERMGRI